MGEAGVKAGPPPCEVHFESALEILFTNGIFSDRSFRPRSVGPRFSWFFISLISF